MSAIAALDWRQIRTWKGSQDAAFEELCCQLARTETTDLVGGGHFERRGAPDAGLECLCRLPNGHEWGWQAKFITESPRAKHWGELDKSVKTALENNPALRRYVICIPTSLPDDRRAKRKSARQSWNEHVRKWTGWFTDRQRTVEFVLWDESALLERLGKPAHVGRRAFWFGGTAFTAEWFAEQAVRPAIRQAHTRYTPPLHVDVPVEQTLEALMRSDEFHKRLFGESERVRRAMEETLGFVIGFESHTSQSVLRKGAEQFVKSVSHWPTTVTDPFDISDAMNSVVELEKSVAEAERQVIRNRSSPDNDRSFVFAQMRELQRALYSLKQFLSSQEVAAALVGKLVVTGDAGSGKTHLFCATAEHQCAKERPVVLLLGEQFHANAEPWTQMQQLLGLLTGRQEFLGALDAVGEALKCRVPILIDALNEGPGISYWRRYLRTMLEQLRAFPRVALAVSIRDAYKEEISNIIAGDAAFVAHHGFRGKVAEAARRFFAHYHLPEPNVPVLDPEYENPLFLKLLCEALRSRRDLRLSDPPSFSDLLQMVLSDANTRLAAALDYDPSERYVQRSVALLAKMMAEQDTDVLSWAVVIEELRKLKPSETRSRSLAQHLVAEDLLVRLPGIGEDSDDEQVRFAYQRFSDYAVIGELLREEHSTGGTGAKTLGRNLSEAEWFPAARSWVEAVATLSPELGGPELPDIAPDFAERPTLRSAFLHSIVWRKRSAISAVTEKHIRVLLARHDEAREETFDTLLSVAARPEHMLNAEWLQVFLAEMTMPERDSIWSTAIFGGWNENGAVKRLIEWGWQQKVAIGLSSDVIRLAGLALAWMLTTSNRFVRDRATKALVSLLENDVRTLREILRRFSEVDEPYLRERLYAVAYGCAMRSSEIEELGRLAQETYDRIFRNRQPPPSVLLRDHARGIVEVARRRNADVECEPNLLVPPFASEPPSEPLADEELRRRFYGHTLDDTHRGSARIYNSVTADDFNHYIIRDVTHWSGTLGGVTLRKSPRQLFAALLDKLPNDSREMMRDLAKLYGRVDPLSSDGEHQAKVIKALRVAERILPRLIGKAHARLFLKRVKPYLESPHDKEFNNHFPIERFERLILQRVLDLGWRDELLGDFDTTVSSQGREDHKPERIGKKYQWMAYDELHARISDNYGLADTSTRVMDREDWERGLWPTDHRDIDPSLLLRSTPRDAWGANHSNWWTPHAYTAWRSKPTPGEWLKSSADVPPITDFIQPSDKTGERWLLLDGFHIWRRKVEAEGSWRPTRDRQELHLIFRSYFTKAANLRAVLNWGKKQDWINDRLPSADHHYHVHLFEHYWSPHFDYPMEDEWITKVWPENDLPAPVVASTGEYLCEQGTYDCSVDSTVTISMPSRWLADKLKIRPIGRNADFVTNDGKVLVTDPSTRERGQSVVLARQEAIRELLRSEDLAVFWTLLGEKNYYPPEMSSKWPGRLTLLGIYSLKGDQISGGFRTEFHPGRD